MKGLEINGSQETQCFSNLTEEEMTYYDEVQRKLPEAYKLFGAIIPLPITTIALILTIFYVTSVFSAIKRRRVSKKYYVLLINRAIGDLLCCVTFIWFSVYLLRTKDLNREVAGVWEMIFTSSLWSSMVSYVSISVLKLYAVYKPFQYRTLRMGLCIRLIIFSWGIFILLLVCAFGALALVKVPALQQLTGCRNETCIAPMYRFRNMMMSGVYFVTLIVYFFTLFFIRRSEAYRNSYRRTPLQNKVSSARLSPSAAVIVAQQKKEKKSSGKSVNANLNLAEFTTIDRETGLPIKKSVEDAPVSRRDAVIRKNLQRFPFWKLSVNVATFAVFNLLHVLFTLFIMFKEGCYYQWHLETMIPLVYSAKTMTSCRIALDAILAFVVDEQIRKGGIRIMETLFRCKSGSSSFKQISCSEGSGSSIIRDSGSTKTRASAVTIVSGFTPACNAIA